LSILETYEGDFSGETLKGTDKNADKNCDEKLLRVALAYNWNYISQ